MYQSVINNCDCPRIASIIADLWNHDPKGFLFMMHHMPPIGGRHNDICQMSDVQRDTARTLYSSPISLPAGTQMIDEMKPYMGTGNARIVKVVRGTKGAPSTEVITTRTDQGGETHRCVTSAGDSSAQTYAVHPAGQSYPPRGLLDAGLPLSAASF